MRTSLHALIIFIISALICCILLYLIVLYFLLPACGRITKENESVIL